MNTLDIIFWSCLMLGGVYTVFTLLMGSLGHSAGHAHDIGHIGHAGHIGDAGHIGHAANTGHVGHTGDSGHVSHVTHAQPGAQTHPPTQQGHGEQQNEEIFQGAHFNIWNYLSPMTVAGFLIGFGGGGLVGRSFHMGSILSILIGTVGGLGMWSGAYYIITKVFLDAEVSSESKQEDMIGIQAQVTVPIDGKHPGMISYVSSGTRQSLRAITEDDELIPTGSVVRIRRIDNNTASVMRIDI